MKGLMKVMQYLCFFVLQTAIKPYLTSQLELAVNITDVEDV